MPTHRLWFALFVTALVSCQHSLEAQAAGPQAPSAQPPLSVEPPVARARPQSGLPDQVARDVAAKALAELPACRDRSATSGTLQIKVIECTELRCIRTCCNTCSYSGLLSGSGPQKGLVAAQVRELLPAFPEQALECEINEWNAQLKDFTLGVTLTEPKASACVQSAAR